jgi:hypothetical protein
VFHSDSRHRCMGVSEDPKRHTAGPQMCDGEAEGSAPTIATGKSDKPAITIPNDKFRGKMRLSTKAACQGMRQNSAGISACPTVDLPRGGPFRITPVDISTSPLCQAIERFGVSQIELRRPQAPSPTHFGDDQRRLRSVRNRVALRAVSTDSAKAVRSLKRCGDLRDDYRLLRAA